MGGHQKLNLKLLIACLTGSFVAFISGNIILALLGGVVHPIPLVGLYFGLFSLLVLFTALTCETLDPRIQSWLWRSEEAGKSWLRMLVASAAFFCIGCIIQFIYGLVPAATATQQTDDYIIVIDNSGSTSNSDPQEERFAATLGFLNKLTDNNRASIIVFSDDAEVLSDLTPVDNEYRDNISTQLSGYDSAGGTDIQVALFTALNTVDDPIRSAMVILLSDGENRVDESLIVSSFNDKNVILNSVGYSYNGFYGTSLLVKLSSLTNGTYYSVNEINQLSGTFDRILYQDSTKRMLLDYRYGLDRTSVLFMLIRILMITTIGFAVSFAFGAVFNNRHLIRQLFIQKAAAGLIAGCVLEFGLFFFLPEFLPRLCATLLLGLIITLYKYEARGLNAGANDVGTSRAEPHIFDDNLECDVEGHLLGEIRRG
jgi:Ca-activated chloride channel family protein